MRWMFVLTMLLASCSYEKSKMVNPIVHDPPGGMPNKTYEYLLPFSRSEVLAEHKSLITPWFDRFLSKSPSEIREKLKADWDKFSAKGAVTFRDYLLTLSPKSIVIDGKKIWLALHSGSNTIMIHEPRTLSQADSDFISKFDSQSIEVFCTHFFEAHEGVTSYTSAISMNLQPISNDNFAKSGNWIDGLFLYYICNGDGIFLAPDGKVGRWRHDIAWNDAPKDDQPSAVKHCFDSFDQFIVAYVEYAQMDRVQKKATVFW